VLGFAVDMLWAASLLASRMHVATAAESACVQRRQKQFALLMYCVEELQHTVTVHEDGEDVMDAMPEPTTEQMQVD
jgi:tRNA pseudouridine-54 N-methylase